MSKKINSEESISALKKKIKDLYNEVNEIVNKHDLYSFESEQEAAVWLRSSPIETLMDSLLEEHKLPRVKKSLLDIKKKFELKKLYEKRKVELEKANSDLTTEYINSILNKIDKIK